MCNVKYCFLVGGFWMCQAEHLHETKPKIGDLIDHNQFVYEAKLVVEKENSFFVYLD